MEKENQDPRERRVLESVERVVNQLWNRVLGNYEDLGRPAGHLFESLEVLDDWSRRKRRGEL